MLTGDDGEVAAENGIVFGYLLYQNHFQWVLLFLQNANVRPFVGDKVLVRGTVIVLGSPIKYDGK